MKLSEVMSTNVESISVDATIQQAAEMMAADDVGFLPVLHENVIAGALTDRDIVIRVIAKGLNAATTNVGEVMSKGVPQTGGTPDRTTSTLEALHADAEIEEAVELMQQRKIRRIAVHDSNYQIVGILSLADVEKATDRPVAI